MPKCARNPVSTPQFAPTPCPMSGLPGAAIPLPETGYYNQWLKKYQSRLNSCFGISQHSISPNPFSAPQYPFHPPKYRHNIPQCRIGPCRLRPKIQSLEKPAILGGNTWLTVIQNLSRQDLLFLTLQ